MIKILLSLLMTIIIRMMMIISITIHIISIALVLVSVIIKSNEKLHLSCTIYVAVLFLGFLLLSSFRSFFKNVISSLLPNP